MNINFSTVYYRIIIVLPCPCQFCPSHRKIVYELQAYPPSSQSLFQPCPLKPPYIQIIHSDYSRQDG